MGFGQGNYMTVWKIDRYDKYTKVNISSSRKNKETNTYDTDYSGFAMMIGNAHNKASEALNERDRIKILSCDVTTRYDKEKNITYTNYAIFDWEPAGVVGGSNTTTTTEKPKTNLDAVVDDDEDLPW